MSPVMCNVSHVTNLYYPAMKYIWIVNVVQSSILQ